ncbi:hypothetical protein Peur_024525 [Populus x canadensis]
MESSTGSQLLTVKSPANNQLGRDWRDQQARMRAPISIHIIIFRFLVPNHNVHFSFLDASSSHLWAALADSSLANDSPTKEEYFLTNREETDSGSASHIGRDGVVLFLEESRALAELEFVHFVYEIGLLYGAVDTLPS